MSKAFFVKCICVIGCFIVSYNSLAQNCSGKLQQAQQLFEGGQIEQIPSLLDSCILHGFSPYEKQKAYQLLIQTYLFDYNQVKSDSLMLTFLRTYPQYTLKPTDQLEFAELFKHYKSRPSWAVGVSAGLNLPYVIVSENYSTANLNKINSLYKPSGISYSAGLIIDRFITRSLWASLNPTFGTINFKNTEKQQSETVTYHENTNVLAVPLLLNLSLGSKTFSPVIFGGGQLLYLSEAKAQIDKHKQPTMF